MSSNTNTRKVPFVGMTGWDGSSMVLYYQRYNGTMLSKYCNSSILLLPDLFFWFFSWSFSVFCLKKEKVIIIKKLEIEGKKSERKGKRALDLH